MWKQSLRSQFLVFKTYKNKSQVISKDWGGEECVYLNTKKILLMRDLSTYLRPE